MCDEEPLSRVEPAQDHPLPAARAFVLQLHGRAEIVRGRWAGRVSHVVSGRSAHFETLAELTAFIERVLAGSGAGRPSETQEPP